MAARTDAAMNGALASRPNYLTQQVACAVNIVTSLRMVTTETVFGACERHREDKYNLYLYVNVLICAFVREQKIYYLTLCVKKS